MICNLILKRTYNTQVAGNVITVSVCLPDCVLTGHAGMDPWPCACSGDPLSWFL